MHTSTRFSLGRGAYLLSGTVLSRLGAFVLLPGALASLTPADFSRFALLQSLPMVLVPLFTWNVHTAPQRLLFDVSTATERRRLVSTCILSAVGLLVISGTVIVVLATLAREELVSGGSIPVRAVVALYCTAAALQEASLWVLRADGRAAEVFAIGGVNFLGLSALTFWLVLASAPSFQLLSIGIALSSLCTCAVALTFIRGDLSEAIDLDTLRSALAFSIPTAVHAIAVWGVFSGGRWIGTFILGLDATAEFNTASLVVNGLSAFVATLYHVRLPEVGSHFASGRLNAGRVLLRGARMQSVFLVVAGYSGLLVVSVLLKVAGHGAVYLGAFAFAAALLASLMHVGYSAESSALVAEKRTRELAKATLIASMVSICAYLALVLGLALKGLLLSLPLSFLAQYLVTLWVRRSRVEGIHSGTEEMAGKR